MNTFWILLEQIGLFVIYIIIGVLLIKTKVFTEITIESISRFVLKLALPVMIFVNIAGGVDRRTLFQSAGILIYTCIFYIFTFLIGKGLSRLFHVKGDQGQVYHALTMFGNVGFMGIPIITSILPQNGMLYISIFTIIDQLVLWTVGVKLTTPSGEGKFDPRKLINPSTVAILLSMVFVIGRIPLPALLDTGLQKIGNTATPLAMIYLGGVFACTDIRRYIRNVEFYGIIFMKMILFPVIFYLLLGFFQTPEEIRLTMSLLGAMPAMSSVVMMAKASGSEGDYAMGGVFVTTLCSIVTIPAVCWILQNLLS